MCCGCCCGEGLEEGEDAGEGRAGCEGEVVGGDLGLEFGDGEGEVGAGD